MSQPQFWHQLVRFLRVSFFLVWKLMLSLVRPSSHWFQRFFRSVSFPWLPNGKLPSS